MSKRLALFDKLITEGSKDPFHHYARALELRSLGRAEEARTAMIGVTEGFPDYVPSFLMAAQLSQQAGDVTRASQLAESGISAAKRAGNDHALSELQSLLDSQSASHNLLGRLSADTAPSSPPGSTAKMRGISSVPGRRS